MRLGFSDPVDLVTLIGVINIWLGPDKCAISNEGGACKEKEEEEEEEEVTDVLGRGRERGSVIEELREPSRLKAIYWHFLELLSPVTSNMILWYDRNMCRCVMNLST